jgi:hypothetical protein
MLPSSYLKIEAVCSSKPLDFPHKSSTQRFNLEDHYPQSDRFHLKFNFNFGRTSIRHPIELRDWRIRSSQCSISTTNRRVTWRNILIPDRIRTQYPSFPGLGPWSSSLRVGGQSRTFSCFSSTNRMSRLFDCHSSSIFGRSQGRISAQAWLSCSTFSWYAQSCANPSGRAVYDVGLRPLGCWGRGFESRSRHGCLSVVLSCVGRSL